MRRRGRGGRIVISNSQLVFSLNIPLTVFEGAGGTTKALNVIVGRSGNFGYPGTVDWAVAGSGANPATAADFGGAFPSGTLEFGPADMQLPIELTIHGNDDADGDRTFTVTLTNPTTTGGSGEAVIGVAAVICTIVDDDMPAGTTNVGYAGADAYYNGDPLTYGNQ